MTDLIDISIILPAKNEAHSLEELLPKLKASYIGAEIIVVNDGSEDETREVCERHEVVVVNHPYSKGNGAAIKSGARRAKGDVLVFMDADSQHRPEDISLLVEKMASGYDMVVGARNIRSQAGVMRLVGNTFYNYMASWMVGQRVRDLTSGFRAVKANLFRDFLHMLPNGFSYPTTITMAFFRAGYSVGYVPIVAEDRKGVSHINLLKDGSRFLIIIFKIGNLYSPLKLFAPVSAGFFLLGVGYYLFTYIMDHRFTNMSALLFSVAIIIFLIGLVSEQITLLQYQQSNPKTQDQKE